MNIKTENSEPRIIEGTKLKLNLDIFNSISPSNKTSNEKKINFNEKKNNEQAQTQPVFQNKLTTNETNNIGNLNNLKTNINHNPNDKSNKFFEEKSNIDLKAQNLTSEINALDRILINKDINHKFPKKNEDGGYLSKLKENEKANNLQSIGLNGRNKPMEIKNEESSDYLQMKMKTIATTKVRKILPNAIPEKNEQTKQKETNLLGKTKEIHKDNVVSLPNILNKKEKNPNGMIANNNPHTQSNKNLNILGEDKLAPTKTIPNDNNEEKLFLCPEGCGRKFNTKALEKHAKVCKKVFQPKNDKQEKNKKEEKPLETNNGKKGKWQKQSEAFRAVVKAAKNQYEATESDKKEAPKKEIPKKTKK